MTTLNEPGMTPMNDVYLRLGQMSGEMSGLKDRLDGVERLLHRGLITGAVGIALIILSNVLTRVYL